MAGLANPWACFGATTKPHEARSTTWLPSRRAAPYANRSSRWSSACTRQGPASSPATNSQGTVTSSCPLRHRRIAREVRRVPDGLTAVSSSRTASTLSDRFATPTWTNTVSSGRQQA